MEQLHLCVCLVGLSSWLYSEARFFFALHLIQYVLSFDDTGTGHLQGSELVLSVGNEGINVQWG